MERSFESEGSNRARAKSQNRNNSSVVGFRREPDLGFSPNDKSDRTIRRHDDPEQPNGAVSFLEAGSCHALVTWNHVFGYWAIDSLA